MTEIVEALDAARPWDTSEAGSQGRTQRSVSVRERPEVQEVLRLRRLTENPSASQAETKIVVRFNRGLRSARKPAPCLRRR